MSSSAQPSGHHGAVSSDEIDVLMLSAAKSQRSGDWLHAAMLCRDALQIARSRGDFELMSRICMPMLEAQRGLRFEAIEAGPIRVITSGEDLQDGPEHGAYLFAPNLVGADARQFRTAANNAGVPVFVLTREPQMSNGLWPIVGVGERVVRIRIEPPSNPEIIDASWFTYASEQLGDQAIEDAKNAGEPDDPAAWLVDDFLDRLDACPEHEKFLMALADACKEATTMPTPTIMRRRALVNDPYSF
ncbi:MAG: hypothetical protein JJ974_01790 [Phycisphaerales bacterium]|nr:hypothetical protein [Phycisphaerales bacterium]